MKIYEKFSQYLSQRDCKVFIFLFCAVTIHLVFGLRFEPTENGIYQHLYNSITTDFDFNVFNQIQEPAEKWLVTKAYNHPDHRLAFTSLLNFIPNLLSKVVLAILPIASALKTSYLSYLFLSLITALQLFKMSIEFKNTDYFKAFFYTCLCSVGIHYLLLDPGEINFASTSFNTLLFLQIFFTSSEKEREKGSLDMALFYFPLALYILIRPEAIFWATAIGLHELLTKNKRRIYLCFTAIFIPLLITVITTDIQLGSKKTLNPIVDFSSFDYFGVLLGDCGLFIMQPIFLLSIIGLMIGLKDQSSLVRRASIFSIVIILMKVTLISSMRSSTIDTFIGRNYMGEIPLWSFGILILLRKYRNWTLILIGVALLVNFFHINLIIYDWMTDDRLVYTSSKNYSFISLAPEVFKKVGSLYHYRFITWDANYYWDILKISTLSAVLITAIQKIITLKRFMSFITALAITFFVLNLSFNKQNVDKMKNKGVFSQVVVGKGDLLYYDEVLDYIHKMETHGEVYDPQEKKKAEEFRRSYIKSTIKDIILDPIGLQRDLENNNIRKSFWQSR
jgi:hypothetical protein